MLKNNKGLITGLTVLIAIVGIVAFLMKGTPAPVSPIAETGGTESPIDISAAMEQPTPPPVVETPAVAASEEGMAAAPEESVPAPPAVETAAAPVADPSSSLLAAPASLDIDVRSAMMERSMGREDAPVTIIEYASLSCSHCAHFANEILPAVKAKLIDTGKARLIFRDFPLDQVAMKAAMMARCAPADKYFNLLEVIFKNQERWIQKEDKIKAVAQLGTLAGMDEEYINACTDNVELEHALLNVVSQAQREYTIKSTPTFVFNSGAEILNGAQPVEKFEEIVNKLSGG